MSRRFAGDERGASAVEMALLMPVFLVIVFGTIEFALIFFVYNAAGHAAWDVTRQLATNQITTAQVEATARPQLPSWMRASANITPASSSTNPNTNKFTVTIAFPASAAAPTGMVRWAYRSLTLTATSTMQQEPTS